MANPGNPTPANPARRIGAVQVAAGIAAVWFCAHVAVYVGTMFGLDPFFHREMLQGLKAFFGWQAIGFLVAAVIVVARRPSAVGRVLGGYLVLSTACLLALGSDAAMVGRLALLLLWLTCVTQGMRLVPAAGVEPATP